VITQEHVAAFVGRQLAEDRCNVSH
jgi:hypothetical protein